MTTTAKMVHRALVGSGALALLLGLIIWTGHGTRLLPIHELLGYVFFLSLWTIAAITARSGVSLGLVVLASTWGLLALILAVAQKELVPGNWHWLIRVLHLVSGIAAIAWGQQLVIRMRQRSRPVRVSFSPCSRQEKKMRTTRPRGAGGDDPSCKRISAVWVFHPNLAHLGKTAHPHSGVPKTQFRNGLKNKGWDAMGRPRATLDYFGANDRILLAQLPVTPLTTVYSRIGDVGVVAAGLFAGAVMIKALMKHRDGS